MKRAHWLVVGSWVGLFAAVAVACGDSATGIPTPEDSVDASTNKDAGAKVDTGSTVVPPKDSSVPDTNSVVDTGIVTDGGLPTISENVLDFGETDCGQTGAAKTFTISNPSSAAVSFTTDLVKSTGSPFTITPSTGSVPGGGQVTVTVTPKAVPVPSTTAANGIGDTIKLSVGPINSTIDLKQTAHGAVLRFSIPAGIDFGNTPLAATAQESAFAVTNAGNATIPIALTIEPDASLDGGASPFALSVNPTSAAPGFKEAKVTFGPTEVRAYSGEIKLTPGAGPLCDVVPANLALKGSGTNGVIAVSPASISFGTAGLVDCSATGTPTKVKITNTSSSAVSYTASLGKTNTVYAISVAPATGTAGTLTGSIAAAPSGGSTSIEILVQPKAIPATANTAPDFFSDVLTIDTTAPTGTTTNKVDLHQTARGAVLTRSTNTVAFGNVSAGTNITQQYTFSNTGNVDITVGLANALSNPPPGIFTQPASATVPAGGFVVPVVTFNPPVRPTYPQALTDTATLAQIGIAPVPLCGPLPAALSLTGSTVAPGTVLTPASLAFGQLACGATGVAITKTIRVQNNGPAATYALAVRKTVNPPFTVTSNNVGDAGTSNLVVPAGGFADISVTANKLLQPLANVNDVTDILDITPDDGARAPLTVNLAVSPQGAIIVLGGTGSPLAFGAAKNPATVVKAISVTNNGNVSADVTFAVTSSVAGVFTSSAPNGSVANGSPLNINLTFTPPAGAATFPSTTNSFALTTATPLCALLQSIDPAYPRGAFGLSGTASP